MELNTLALYILSQIDLLKEVVMEQERPTIRERVGTHLEKYQNLYLGGFILASAIILSRSIRKIIIQNNKNGNNIVTEQLVQLILEYQRGHSGDICYDTLTETPAMSKRELAKLLNVTPQTIRNWIRSGRVISMSDATEVIADLLLDSQS